MIFGAPALRRLMVLKFRGGLRRQGRKLKTKSGCLFASVGLALTCFWIGSLFVGRLYVDSDPLDQATVMPLAQLALLVFTGMSVMAASSIRGLYLPAQDIERLFAAPLTRADLLRYRMMVDLGRSLFGALVLGLITFHRLPRPAFGLPGIVLSILTLGLLRQFFSLAIGGAGSRLERFLAARSMLFFRIVLGISAWLLIMSMIMGFVLGDEMLAKLIGDFRIADGLDSFLSHPVMGWVLAPFYPWARMVTAASLPEFLGWFSFCLGMGVVLFETTARMPVDFREMALETSSRIATRLSQFRRGGMFTGGKASAHTVGWRLPKLFGQSPAGAVAWVKWIAIIRKARGALITGTVIVVLVTVGVSALLASGGGSSEGTESIMGSVLIAVLGITYLCGALRFDFRSDLDHMAQIKAWPVSTRRIFVATLGPAVALISILLGGAIWLRLAVLGLFDPTALVVPLVVPFFAFAWLGVENVVFLFAPVRYVPGQEGSLHHTGRAIILVFLRLLLMTVVVGLMGVVAGILYAIGPESIGLTVDQGVLVSACAGFLVLAAVDVALACMGGRMLQRFDVARDRG